VSALPPWLTPSDDGVIVAAFVQPRAGRSAVAGTHAGALKLKVTAPPLDDRANRAVEDLLARLVGMPRADVTVVAGRTSRYKRIKLVGITPERAAAALSA
jgi:uncharacterized protein